MSADSARFLQIHSLHSYTGALLNRDDAGLAKRLPFGGRTRTRISSQCLKRHWRKVEDDWALSEIGLPMATRSRVLFHRELLLPLIAGGLAEDVADAVTAVFQARLLQESEKARKGKDAGATGKEPFETGQALMFGQPELDFLRERALAIGRAHATPAAARQAAEEWFKDEKKNFEALRQAIGGGAGLEGALFGRMVTSDILARPDAAVHVAHAFTVHAEESESDYFTVVDDLRQESGEAGSAGIFDVELTSGLYYGYVVVDLRLLVANLSGQADLAAKVVEHLVHLIATVSPGAKRGSTAPYGWARLMLIEAGKRQPRSLANAFETPVAPALEQAVEALAHQLQAFDEMYGATEQRRHAAERLTDLPGSSRVSLDALARWAAETVAPALEPA